MAQSKATAKKKVPARLLPTQKTRNPILVIVQLYPKEMNIYGDTGNTLVLRRRAEWRGITVEERHVGVGEPIPADADIILGGGGQDAGQGAIEQDMQSKAPMLHKMAKDGTVMLMICGMYQLFGRTFITGDGQSIAGIGIFPLQTVAGKERLIGNTRYEMPFGEVVGYENHSGLTTLDNPGSALGNVLMGKGNNVVDGTEGCRVNNVFGTYSHGPVLAKNPAFADELLRLALERKYDAFALKPLDDSIEQAAHETAKHRPR